MGALLVAIVLSGIEPEPGVRLVERSDGREVRQVPPVPAGDSGAQPEARASRLTPVSFLAKDLKADTDLGHYFAAALASPDAEDRTSALKLAVLCTVLPSDTDMAARARRFEPDEALQRRFLGAMTTARTRLAQFCSRGDSQAFIDAFKHKQFSVGDLRQRALRSSEADPSPWQALMLASPEKHAMLLDQWLDEQLVLLVPPELSVQQIELIRDEVYRRLSADADAASIRQIQRCAIQSVCEGFRGLDPDSRAEAMAQALRIEDLIRRQQWPQLLKPPAR